MYVRIYQNVGVCVFIWHDHAAAVITAVTCVLIGSCNDIIIFALINSFIINIVVSNELTEFVINKLSCMIN